MDDDTKQTRRGAPVTERRRVPIGIRVTPELREELVARAEAKGRSITQEIELLIERGLLIEKLLSTGLYEVMREFDRAGSRRAGELGVDGNWEENPECYMSASYSAIQRILEKAPGPWEGELWHTYLEQALISAQERKTRGQK
jgi:hypothetical protein